MDEEQLELSSTNIWRKSAVEKYEERPPEMEDITLAEFVTEYNINKLTKRRKTAILRCRGSEISDVVNYKREHVMLYLAFRKENDFLDCNEFETIFDDNKERIMEVKTKYNKGVSTAELLEKICEINIENNQEVSSRNAQEDGGESSHARLVQENDDTDIVPESTVTSVVVAAGCPGVKKREDCMPLEEFYARMKMTNHRQRMIIEEVIHRVTNEDAKPLRIFFTGPAGCGKTFTLRLIMDVYNRYCKSKKIGYGDSEISGVNAYIACATTGKAAVALNGITVHSAFKICTTSGQDRGLSAADLNTFRFLFKGVRCVIIDEVSMLSSDLLRHVDRRLRQIRCDRMDEPFGGFDIILCGDLRQLPPVRAAEVFKRPKASASVFITEVIPWHHLEYFPLTQVVRQSDAVFSNLLTKIGDSAPLEDFEVALLESRFVDLGGAAQCPDAVRLYYSNNEVDSYNEKVANLSQNKVEHPARDVVLGHRSQEEKELANRGMETFSRAETGNLPALVVLCMDKPYMLLRNIDITDGLVNGMVGTLKLIEYDAQSEPCRVWLRYPAGVGVMAKAKKLAQRERGYNRWDYSRRCCWGYVYREWE
ncbi:ATP-dependent DNA helicase PIF1-like [Amblyomma americanum]